MYKFEIKLTSSFQFKIDYSDSHLGLDISILKYSYSYSKQFIKLNTCTQCGKKYEDDYRKFNLCEEHEEDFIEAWKERLDGLL